MQQSIKDALTGQSITGEYGDGRVVAGEISGRLQPFAHVWLKDDHGYDLGMFEVSWETIARCKANGRPIRL